MRTAYQLFVRPLAVGSRLDAYAVVAALTLALGMLSHVLVEAVVTGSRLQMFTASHGAMAIVAAIGLAWSIGRVTGGYERGERRRITALLRATLHVDSPRFLLAVSLAQATIVAVILLLERITIAPGEMLAAVISGVLAVVAGTLALHLARRRVLVVLLAFARMRTRGPAPYRINHTQYEPRTCAAIPFLRSRPDRAPPQVLIA